MARELARRGRVLIAPGLALSIVCFYLFRPLWGHLGQGILGDATSDAIRGMWSFDYLAHTVVPPSIPFLSTWGNFPEGVAGVVLPFVSGLVLAPLGWIFGPVVGWNLGVIVLVWAAGLGVAWLVHELSDSWPAGVVAGAVTLSQPTLLHAVCDGTAEHLALWGIPVFLVLLRRAIRAGDPKQAAWTGAFVLVMALDSPYHSIYAALMAAAALPFFLQGDAPIARRLKAVAIIAAVAGVSTGLLMLTYRSLNTGSMELSTIEELRSFNAVDIRVWLQYDSGAAGVRSLANPPALIPTVTLVGLLVFSFLGGRQGLPWLAMGLLMVVLAFGVRQDLPSELGGTLGGLGAALGRVVSAVNGALYDLPPFNEVRFPRRWLVPATMAMSVAAGIGLGRVFGRVARQLPEPATRVVAPALALALALGAASVGMSTARFHQPFPAHVLPRATFAEWIREQPGDGAVLLLPQFRPYVPGTMRDELPVFASLGSVLSSADSLYLQTVFARPLTTFPSLQTLRARAQPPEDVAILLRDWDDLGRPVLSNVPIPNTALDPAGDAIRQAGVRYLMSAGLRFVAVDLGVYSDVALAEFRRQLALFVAEARAFEDGDGVLVLELGLAR